MPHDRLPLRPPPGACHAFVPRPLPDGAGRPGAWYDARCGQESTRLHGTTDPALVTCPRCVALVRHDTTRDEE